ncbi:MAG TPA: molybdopterin cofactor-binding domain-containing protein, partial [Ktedonobacteraceae bacterium]|nr:molybdopterin cofactor-binding domain-containing protein [Ktedonobacteraceae bacterium]
ALESHMDEVARQLGIDVLELRRKNWIKAGEEYPLALNASKGGETAPLVESCGLSQCLRIVEEKIKWEERHRFISDGRFYRGAGVALSMHGSPGVRNETSGAMIKLNEDGSFDVFAGANDSGSGTATLVAQIAAETLGVSVDDILMHTSDTTSMPFETGVGGSSALYVSGGAVKKAAEQVRRQMLAVAGRILNALPEALKIVNGTITAPNGQTATIPEVAAYSLHVEGRHLMTTASWKGQQTPTAFAAQGVEIEVDTETGNIRILNAVSAVDVGRAINPNIQEAQIQGGAAQSLGAGISEELIYDQKGNPLTTTFHDYHIYTATDIPGMQTYLVETGDPSGPFGAKSVAEIPLYGMAPAIANAVTDALGVRVRQIPLTPERVLRAIHAHNSKQP